ncbi:MAG: hypothetical protein QXJ27_00245 [Thermoplasmata archaeon]
MREDEVYLVMETLENSGCWINPVRITCISEYFDVVRFHKLLLHNCSEKEKI